MPGKTTSGSAGNNRWLPGPAGMWESSIPAGLLTILCIGIVGASLYLSGGNMKIVIAAFLPLAVIGLTFYRLEYSFLLLFACVLVFDQFLVVGFKPLTYYADFFRNFKEISYLPSHPAGIVNPIELYLMLIIGVWLLILAVQKKIKLRSIPVWLAFLFFVGWLFFALLNGLIGGGKTVIAFWEIRGLFYLSVMYLIVPQIIQKRSHIRMVIWISIAAIFFKACQGIYRFGAMGFSTGAVQTFTNHEDPVFMSTLFILLAVMLLLKYKDKQRTVLLLLALPLILGFFVSLRRAAFAGLFVSLAALFLILDKRERIRYLKMAIPVLCLFVVYGAAFWNSNSALAQPVQMIKSGLVKPNKTENPDDYYSNLYREYENYNLASTVQRKPVAGIGFGKKFDRPLDLFDIQFPLKEYIPHNQILWWLVKTGAIGFFGFWIFFNAFAFKGVRLYTRTHDPYLKAVCAMAVVAIINQMVVSYFDLQLTYYRNMIYLGTLMGLMPSIEKLQSEQEESGSG